MNEGFILLHRKIKDNWLFQRSDYFHWFTIMLFKANFKEVENYLFNGCFIDVERGQFVTSINNLAQSLPKCSDKKVRTFLKLLVNSEIIKTENLQKGTRITICNYDSYQGEGQGLGKVRASEGQGLGKVRATIERKRKKEKKENNENNDYKKTLLSNLNKSDFDNSEHFDITIAYYELFKKNIIEAGGSTSMLEKAKGIWIDSIRLLLTDDKQSRDSIRIVFEFLQTNGFWKKVILSTSKLREKFNQLLIDANSQRNGKTNGNTKSKGATPEQVAEILAKKFKERRNAL